MFLENIDVIQVVSCVISQEYRLQMIWIYIVMDFVHHE